MSQQARPYEDKLRREYGALYEQIRWIDGREARMLEEERSQLLTELAPSCSSTGRGSKIYSGSLSPGCRHCVEGNWSCLFINGRCNANCFFCPSKQKEIGTPATNTLSFSNPGEYGEYLDRFGFSGSSISGGEPFVTFDRTLSFVKGIKKRFGDRIHLWMYTNGFLHDERKVGQLRDAGLGEMRFNILATRYNLDPLRRAVGVIPTVTVEIPAVPEDENRLADLLPELRDMGVAHLNLHQLRLTPFNFPRMEQRGYRFLKGAKATVPASELTALRLIAANQRKSWGFSINNCSFIYKHRYQALAARKRWGKVVLRSTESITEAGYIRNVAASRFDRGGRDVVEILAGSGAPADLWKSDGEGARVQVHHSLLSYLTVDLDKVWLTYSSASAREAPSGYGAFREVELGPRRSIFVERGPVTPEIGLTGNAAQVFLGRLIGTLPSVQPFPAEVEALETTQEGLQSYRWVL